MGLTKPRAHQLEGSDYKASVRVVTVANVTLSGGAPTTVDGVTLVANDRVLVTAQSTGSQNGIYRVKTLGTGSDGTWVRSKDADTNDDVTAGMVVMVTEGTTYGDTQWKLTTNDAITVGTTSLTFSERKDDTSVAGSDTQVQFNDGGSLAGDSGLVFNKTTDALTVTGNVTGGNLITSAAVESATVTASGNITSANLTVSDIATYNTVDSSNSNLRKINQRYTGAASGSYFSQNEYQKVVTITPSADSQNYQISGRVMAQSAGSIQIIEFDAALRSETLPSLAHSQTYSERHNGTAFFKPQLWVKETTTAGFIFALQYLHSSSLFGSVTVDLDIIPRASDQKSNVTVNTTVDSEQTSVDTGFTANDFTKIQTINDDNVTFEDTTTMSAATVTGNVTGGNLITSALMDSATIHTSGLATLAQATIEDLTDDQVVVATTGGRLANTNKLTFDESTLAITGALTASTNITATANITGGNLHGDNLTTANAFVIVGSSGHLTEDTTLSVDTGSNYLGINQTSPEVTLHMTGDGAQSTQIRMEQYNDSADAPDIRSRRGRGTYASQSAVQSGDYIFRLNSEYYNGTGNIIGGALAFDNTNNAARTQFSVAVDTDGTGADASGSNGQFKIDGNDSGAITFNNAYKFPTSDGSANNILATDGSGALSFTGDPSFTTVTASGNITGGNLTTSAAMDSATINTTGEATLASAIVSDLTDNRVVIAGSSGAIEDDANFTFDGTTLGLSTTGTGDLILLTATENSATASPVITFKRNSSSPADADYLGQLKFKGENDADEEITYAKITGKILDASDSTEDGIIEFAHKKAGSNTITARFRSDSYQLLNSTSLTVNGAISTDATVTATGNITGGNIISSARYDSSNGGAFRWFDSDGSHYFELKAAGTTTANKSYQWPSTDGSNGQVLTTNGAATLSWADSGEGGTGGFSDSTITVHPAADGDESLGTGPNDDTEETPFESGGADAFGVSLGSVYDQMEPVGSTTTVDLGAFT